MDEALGGREAAVRELVAYLTPGVHAVVLRYLGGWTMRSRVSDARQARDELYQEVMLELFAKDGEALGRFDPARAGLQTYARRIAAHTCYRVVSRRPAPPLEELPEAVPDPAPPEQARTLAKDLLSRLYDRLEQALSPTDLLVFKLAVVQDLDAAEVERQTGVPVKNVHVRKFRIRQRAQAILRELEAEASEPPAEVAS